jgi:hypothetical protein
VFTQQHKSILVTLDYRIDYSANVLFLRYLSHHLEQVLLVADLVARDEDGHLRLVVVPLRMVEAEVRPTLQDGGLVDVTVV